MHASAIMETKKLFLSRTLFHSSESNSNLPFLLSCRICRNQATFRQENSFFIFTKFEIRMHIEQLRVRLKINCTILTLSLRRTVIMNRSRTTNSAFRCFIAVLRSKQSINCSNNDTHRYKRTILAFLKYRSIR